MVNINKFTIGIITSAALFISCSNLDRYNHSSKKVDKFFFWLEQGSIDSIYTLFVINTNSKSDSIKFRDDLLKLNKKGRIVSKRNYSTIQRREHSDGSKITYTHLKYIVSYKDSSVFHFSFVFVKDKKNDDNIISYNSIKIYVISAWRSKFRKFPVDH